VLRGEVRGVQRVPLRGELREVVRALFRATSRAA
jgi:hypothetical protein